MMPTISWCHCLAVLPSRLPSLQGPEGFIVGYEDALIRLQSSRKLYQYQFPAWQNLISFLMSEYSISPSWSLRQNGRWQTY